MILLARHGHVHNPGHVLYGNLPGFHLSPVGRWQSMTLGRRVRRVSLAAVYSSPLERATETAWVATGRTAVTVPELSDWEPHPDWVGRPWEEIARNDPERWAAFDLRPWFDGRPAARALMRIAGAHAGRNVLVVGHQDPLRAAINALHPVPGARLREDPLPLCCLRTLAPRTWRVVDRWDPPAPWAWPTGPLVTPTRRPKDPPGGR